jgi:DUF1009 family protein
MLALIAGRGQLPAKVAGAQAEPPLICALEDQPPDSVTADLTFRLETLGSLLLQLGERGITEICLCGAIDRPALDPTKLDTETKPLVPLFQEALSKGDDGALRIVMQIFEQTGFRIRAAHDLAPKVVAEAGMMSARTPRAAHEADARAGAKVLAEMGAADLGQACVIRKGAVLAREDEAGTDAMLARLAMHFPTRPKGPVAEWMFDDAGGLSQTARDWLNLLIEENFDSAGVGGVLCKAPKPGQDRRADLPTIGPLTALVAAEAGLDGIVIEAGGVIVIDPEMVTEIVDAMNMFLWVRP